MANKNKVPSWKKPGTLGLQRAREKSHEKKLKKMAKSKEAYTIKVKTTLPDFSKISAGDRFSPEDICASINKRAANGSYLNDYNKEGLIIGHIIRAFMTDTGEIWARVIRLPEPVAPQRPNIW